MQKAMDVPRHAASRVPVADAIGKHHACEIVAAGEHRGKIAAFFTAGGHGDNVALQSRQLQRAVRSLISGPQLHATEGPRGRLAAIKLFRLDLLELHTCFDVGGTFLGAELSATISLLLPPAV
jgi:hypothetical protein